jgi:hypothetical protein
MEAVAYMPQAWWLLAGFGIGMIIAVSAYLVPYTELRYYRALAEKYEEILDQWNDIAVAQHDALMRDATEWKQPDFIEDVLSIDQARNIEGESGVERVVTAPTPRFVELHKVQEVEEEQRKLATNKYIDQLLSVIVNDDKHIKELDAKIRTLKDTVCTWQAWYDSWATDADGERWVPQDSPFPDPPSMTHIYKGGA